MKTKMKLNEGKQPARAHKIGSRCSGRDTPSHTLRKKLISLAGDGKESGGGNLFARRLQGRDTSKPGAGLLRVFMRLRLDAKVSGGAPAGGRAGTAAAKAALRGTWATTLLGPGVYHTNCSAWG